MTASEWVVLTFGVAAIAWVNWYFFFAERATAVVSDSTRGTSAADSTHSNASPADGIPVVSIEVKGGYAPGTIRTKAGQPVRLVFDRQETSSCSEEVVFPDFGIKRFLPAFKQTTIEVTPPKPGRYEFTCGMSMLRGTLIAE